MNLIERCLQHDWHRIAFIGATKHAGKTTAMNAFIEDAHAAGQKLALCSIGLDGERLDTILGVAKPPVFVPAGTLIASAEAALEQAEARYEYLADLGITSPLGNVMLVRTTSAGNVQLAGVRQRRHVEDIVPKLMGLGADFCLVDGAFDRVAAAAPHLVDAAIFAVGAVAGRTIEEVAAAAADGLRRFTLPAVATAVPAEVAERLRVAAEAGDVGVYSEKSGLVMLPARQTVLGLRQHPDWSSDATHVYVPGAITDALLQHLAGHAQPLALVAAHPAQVLATDAVLRQWFRAGHTLYVWHRLPLVGVAANPHSITGYELPAAPLMEALRNLIPDVPVYDAVQRQEAGDVYA